MENNYIYAYYLDQLDFTENNKVCKANLKKILRKVYSKSIVLKNIKNFSIDLSNTEQLNFPSMRNNKLLLELNNEIEIIRKAFLELKSNQAEGAEFKKEYLKFLCLIKYESYENKNLPMEIRKRIFAYKLLSITINLINLLIKQKIELSIIKENSRNTLGINNIPIIKRFNNNVGRRCMFSRISVPILDSLGNLIETIISNLKSAAQAICSNRGGTWNEKTNGSCECIVT